MWTIFKYLFKFKKNFRATRSVRQYIPSGASWVDRIEAEASTIVIRQQVHGANILVLLDD